MHKVFLGIGGNVGNKKENLIRCQNLVEKRLGKTTLVSSVYETPPWGFQSENNFWNQVICIHTEKSPDELLIEIRRIEAEFGRDRTKSGYNSREMDIDILYFDNLQINVQSLIIPHPLIHERLFVLTPLCEIAPDYIHPVLRKNTAQLLENCSDTSPITKVNFE